MNPATSEKKTLSLFQIFGLSALVASGLLLFLIVSLLAIVYSGHRFRLQEWQYSFAHYNEELEQRALSAGLVGSPVGQVPLILGPPTNVRTFWTTLDSNMQPTNDSRYVTTYEYYPNPLLPLSKFQVHTENGVVQSLEKYDD
jgi:hypothetical protein